MAVGAMATAAEAEVKLELKSVSKSYVDRGRQDNVLANIELTVHKDEFVSVVGPSGSGKSTLFHIVGGVVKPDSGAVMLDGEEATGRRGLVTYMPQQDSLFPWRTVLDNAIMSAEIAGMSKKEARRQAREWLGRVGLSGYEHALPHQLSGGMRQRVSFLRALLSPRELMLLDEPFGALDALTRMEMQQWLLSIWEEMRRSVLFVTHSIEEALLLSDRIYVLSGKPATVALELDVPFPRPRSRAVVMQSEFVTMKEQIHNALGVGQPGNDSDGAAMVRVR